MTDLSPAPLMWIDATRPAAIWHLWGMTLVERLLREGARQGLRQACVVIDADAPFDSTRLRPDLTRLHDMDVRFVTAARAGLNGSISVLLCAGDVVHDDRVLAHLLAVGPGHVVVGEHAAAAHLSAASLQAHLAAGPQAEVAALPGVATVPLQALGHYVPDLRLTMVPFLERISNAEDLRRVDHLLFHRTFKGVIDAVARYGYYHFVRCITRWLSRTTVSPNLLTLLSIVSVWAAIPCFATGQLGWGVLSAWLGVILDSVDGKLARLTINLSDAMGRLEHAAAMPGLGLWFVALGWHLTDGRLLSGNPMSVACWVLVGTFLADKILTGAFRRVFGYELFDARPLDAAFHLLAARRNIHLLLLTVGVVLARVAPAYEWMAAGMVASFTFHAVRFAWIAVTGSPRETA
ncbi:MAG: CDP-alcohol phosphatidyltransferase family protein [bacterium]|nr:CDP-alcohol phosphatidyltransferase family protein [bacterium]